MTPTPDDTAIEAPPKPLHWLQRGFAKLTGIDQQITALPPAPPSSTGSGNGREQMIGYAWAVVACALVTLLALAVSGFLAPANMVLLYLMAVVLVAVRFGRKPGILTSFLAVLAFDFFLVLPYRSLTVADTQYLLTFAIMLTVAIIISNLAAHLRHQAQIAYYRERRTSALFDLSKDLSGALANEQILDIGTRHIEAMFQARVTLLLPDRHGKLQLPAADTHTDRLRIESGKAQQVYDQQRSPELESRSLNPGRVLYLPLRAPMRTRGVLAVLLEDTRQLLIPDQLRLLQTCAAQIALAVERVHYVEVAHEASVEMESERLRNSLLSAISHDVRTPLTAIVGLASTLAGDRPLPHGTRRELVEAIQEEALRMSNLVTNLLDMARLHAGGVKLNLQWQMLEEVVGSALGVLSRTLEGRHIEVALPAALPLLNFDAVLIERVLCNLLANAVKYTPQGSPLRIAAQSTGDEIQVSLEDKGPGVPAGLEKPIFDKFTRGDAESARSGVGLGLSICRAIIEAHGGRIWAENLSDGGARFTFTLPVGSPPAWEEQPEAAEPARTEDPP